MKMQGIIIFYLPSKGYGYVRVPDTREEFRFRTINLSKPVEAGDHVWFVLKEDRKGYFADEVEPLRIT